MDPISVGWANAGYDLLVTYLPGIIGAIIILLIGWIVGRLLGKIVRIILDKISQMHMIEETGFTDSFKRAGITIGYIGDIAVRIIVYLVAILAAVDVLQMEYISALMTSIVDYIPHVVAFVIILVVGLLLIDYFINFLTKFYGSEKIELMSPVLFLLRIFLYFVTIILALSQLMLDLTIIYTFVTPIAWGIGLGLGAAIAILVGFGLKNRSEAIMDRFIESLTKKP
jgi:small-conductance mechanosensitive channel